MLHDRRRGLGPSWGRYGHRISSSGSRRNTGKTQDRRKRVLQPFSGVFLWGRYNYPTPPRKRANRPFSGRFRMTRGHMPRTPASAAGIAAQAPILRPRPAAQPQPARIGAFSRPFPETSAENPGAFRMRDLKSRYSRYGFSKSVAIVGYESRHSRWPKSIKNVEKSTFLLRSSVRKAEQINPPAIQRT